jgi:hypothetical protein
MGMGRRVRDLRPGEEADMSREFERVEPEIAEEAYCWRCKSYGFVHVFGSWYCMECGGEADDEVPDEINPDEDPDEE